jgi:pimeloyl-ACP methyl ester carboxylesterase
MENPYPSQYLTINQIRLHYKTAGPIDGDPVVLLHGFPEFWYGWRNQIPALTEAGYRVIIPDQRGYHLSDKPRGIRNYSLDLLAGDVIALIDALGYERVHLAGHDWGAVVAWWVAMHSPSRVNRLAILNGPHPYVMFQNLLHNRNQRRRSWYMFFFQLPFLPELLLSQNGHERALRLLKSSSLSGSFSSEDLSQYRQAWSQPRAWTGMINWYRAIRRRVGGKGSAVRVQVPVLLIWGEKDAAFEPVMVEQSLKFCPAGRLELVPRAAHWVQHDAADKVNAWLVDFFRQ